MKIENLQEFVTLCEYCNFTTAAKKLYTAQPSLSYRIAAMEKELGFALIERTPEVKVTPAGRIFLTEAQEIIQRYQTALDKCKAAAKQKQTLTIERPAGFPRTRQQFDFVLSLFAHENPDIDITFKTSRGTHLKDLLLGGEIDVGVEYSTYDFADENEIAEKVIIHPVHLGESFGCTILVHKNNPLASKERIYVEDLQGAKLAIQSDARFRIGWRSFEELFAPYGVTFEFRAKAAEDEVDFLWQLNEDDIVISDLEANDSSHFGLSAFPHFVMKPIETEQLRVPLSLVYLADNKNPALSRLVCFLDAYAEALNFS